MLRFKQHLGKTQAFYLSLSRLRRQLPHQREPCARRNNSSINWNLYSSQSVLGTPPTKQATFPQQKQQAGINPGLPFFVLLHLNPLAIMLNSTIPIQ